MTTSLEVNREALAQGLRLLRKFVRATQAGEAILSYGNGTLSIEFGETTAQAPAEGTWPGKARVPGLALLQLESTLPPTDPVSFQAGKDRLSVGKWSTPCHWEDEAEQSSGPVIQLPANPPLTLILGLPQRYSDQDIARSGLDLMVRMAEQRRDTLIAQAAAILQPLGVDLIDLRRVVGECVKRKNED